MYSKNLIDYSFIKKTKNNKKEICCYRVFNRDYYLLSYTQKQKYILE